MRARGLAAWVVCSALLAACSSSAHAPGQTPGRSAVAGTAPSAASTSPSPQPAVVEPALPAPDEPIPTDPAGLAQALVSTDQRLRAAIDGWTAAGGASTGQAPDDVVLLALYEQRMFRELAGDAELADKAIPLLPKPLRGQARANYDAAQDLRSLLTTPVSSAAAVHTGKPKPAGLLLSWFQEAEARFGVRWEVLAAVMFVESRFGRVRSASTAGAQGPMQFIASTWAAYGMGGDVHDAHDAILGAANYLHASGAPADERDALYSYNHAWAYVDAILAYADQMAQDPTTFYAYYNWQVWTLTPTGAVRLTGPGL